MRIAAEHCMCMSPMSPFLELAPSLTPPHLDSVDECYVVHTAIASLPLRLRRDAQAADSCCTQARRRQRPLRPPSRHLLQQPRLSVRPAAQLKWWWGGGRRANEPFNGMHSGVCVCVCVCVCVWACVRACACARACNARALVYLETQATLPAHIHHISCRTHDHLLMVSHPGQGVVSAA